MAVVRFHGKPGQGSAYAHPQSVPSTPVTLLTLWVALRQFDGLSPFSDEWERQTVRVHEIKNELQRQGVSDGAILDVIHGARPVIVDR